MKEVRPSRKILESETKENKSCRNADRRNEEQPTPAKVEQKSKDEYLSKECFKHGWNHRWCVCGSAAWRSQRLAWRQRRRVQKIDHHHTWCPQQAVEQESTGHLHSVGRKIHRCSSTGPLGCKNHSKCQHLKKYPTSHRRMQREQGQVGCWRE